MIDGEIKETDTQLYSLAWRSGFSMFMIPHTHACHYTINRNALERLILEGPMKLGGRRIYI